MRVLIAPDKFAGTLSAVEAAEAIAAGWRRAAPGDTVELSPVSDGGPGFIDVLRAAIRGTSTKASVRGPLGHTVGATVLRDGDVAYVETAQACGLEQVPPERRDPTVTTTYGVGELVALAVTEGAQRCVLGLGGSATNDGGAGMLAALGAQPAASLRRGGLALRELTEVHLEPARSRLATCDLVAATDVDNPLLGPYGASATFGPQKGATPGQVAELEGALEHWAELTDGSRAGWAGAGAAGGLGHGLFLLGARRESGIESVLRAVRLAERIGTADLVITGEGSFDSQSLRGKAVSGVARLCMENATPAVVLAGDVAVDSGETSAAGIEAAYSVARHAGSVQAAMTRPAEELAALAERVAADRTR